MITLFKMVFVNIFYFWKGENVILVSFERASQSLKLQISKNNNNINNNNNKKNKTKGKKKKRKYGFSRGIDTFATAKLGKVYVNVDTLT